MRLFHAALVLSALGVVAPDEDVQGIPDECFKMSAALVTARKKRDARINKDILNCRRQIGDCLDYYEDTKMYRDFQAACKAARGSFQRLIRDLSCKEYPYEPEMYDVPECLISQKVNKACDPELLLDTDIESFVDVEGCTGSITVIQETIDYYIAPMNPAMKPHVGPVMRPAPRRVRH
jgi:hypothetical protein